MWTRVRDTVAGALRNFAAGWRTLAITDLAYKALAFAILTPATALFLRWLLSRTGSRVVADVDIARFFVTTPAGITALILGGAIFAAITALEIACLMAVGAAIERGHMLDARGALAFTAKRAGAVLRVAVRMIVLVISGAIPLILALGLVYITFLRDHDINYFLSRKPPAFWGAAILAGLIAAIAAALALGTIARWALALPILLFEDISPRHVLRESAKRSEGHRTLILLVLAGWAFAAFAISAAATWLLDAIVRNAAPAIAGSLATLLLFMTALMIVSAAIAIAIAILNASIFSLLIVRLWMHAGAPEKLRLRSEDMTLAGRRIPRVAAIAAAATAVLLAAGVALVAFLVTRGNEPVLVLAHRGSSLSAPENTLAAFRQAVEDEADFVELDVQESLDGVVLVTHDADLMKVAGSPTKIWEHTAAELRSIDIGSHKGRQFSSERVPTLAEALAACKGRTKVMIELKTYGHNQRLEQRVVEIVEAAGMEKACAYMSLDHDMARRMKRLRPSWRVGMLIAKALGDPTTLDTDFLAVEARMATPRFVRRAHRAGKDVYVWTVNDPAWMLTALSRGVDGLITDNPALARKVVERRAKLSDAQRLAVALLIRSGARVTDLEAENALRP